MAYLALYRAWRPQTFQDVVGQTHITKTLQNALKVSRFSHAYLFSGSRGTGKTSTAKILAKTVNCELGPTSEPCNQCNTCKGISNGSILEVVEIDAASNRGVEEIRDLREKVKFAPSQVRYKVYIIDEVHMLTTEAFNALLKTLEEPPEHVIFILATTEPHKLPSTIISRCQRFDFKRISSTTMVNRLQEIVKAEGFSIQNEALVLIAQHSEGGMRDALSLLDQVLSFSGGNIGIEDVLKVTGRISHQFFSEMAKEIYEGNANVVLENIDHYIEDGKDPEKIIEDLLYYYRDLLLYKSAPDLDELKEKVILDPDFPKISDMHDEYLLYEIIETLNKYLNDIKWTNQPRIILELALIKISRIKSSRKLDSLLEKEINDLKDKIIHFEKLLNTAKAVEQPAVVESKNKEEKKRKIASKGSSESTLRHLKTMSKDFNNQIYSQVIQKWPDILQKVKEEKVTVHAWLVDGEPVAVTSKEIIIAFKNDMHRITTEKPANRQLIEQVLESMIGQGYLIFTIMKKDWDYFKEELSNSTQNNEAQPSKKEDDLISKAYEMFDKDVVVIKD